MYLILQGICIIILSVLCGIVLERIYIRIAFRQLQRIKVYLRLLDKTELLVSCKGKIFYIKLKYKVNDPVYKYEFYINNELAVEAYQLHQGLFNSYQLDYNFNRNQFEIAKIQRKTLKKLKRLYRNSYTEIYRPISYFK